MEYETVFHECRTQVVEALRDVDKIESIGEDPSTFINEHFDLNKRHIGWRRDDLIAEINKYSQDLVQENESNRAKCLQLAVKNNHITRLSQSKVKLILLRKQLDTFVSFNKTEDQVKFERVKATLSFTKDRLSQILSKYKESLLEFKDPMFIFFDRPVQDVFGKIIDNKQVESHS